MKFFWEAWEANEKAYKHIVLRAWVSHEFQNRLFEDPVKVLNANGFTFSAKDVEIKFVEGIKNPEWLDYKYQAIALPWFPRPDKVSNEELLARDVNQFVISLGPVRGPTFGGPVGPPVPNGPMIPDPFVPEFADFVIRGN